MPTVRCGEVDVHYREAGSGEAIVWIPGTGLLAEMWDGQVAQFASTNRCVALDLRGSGRTEGGGAEFSVADLADDVAGLLDALGIASAHVVGLSLGSAVAQELALRRPDLVRSAVLVATWSSSSREHHIRRHFESRLYALENGPLDVFAQFAFWMSAPSVVDDEPELQLAVEEALAGQMSRRLDGTASHFRADIGHETSDRLAGIGCRTLVIHGDEDLITLPAYNQRVADLVPGAVLETIKGAGHLVWLERPRELSSSIGSFLSGEAR
jgi:pimeloyl-ACP methyl ester carboxylesterase